MIAEALWHWAIIIPVLVFTLALFAMQVFGLGHAWWTSVRESGLILGTFYALLGLAGAVMVGLIWSGVWS